MEGSEEVAGGCDGRTEFVDLGGDSRQRVVGERPREYDLVCSPEHHPIPLTFLPSSLLNSGFVRIDDIEYRWKTKGTGSKVVVRYRQLRELNPGSLISSQLVNKVTGEIVAQSHSRIRSSFFRKPRDMSLEISDAVSHAVDVVLLTFILVWRERQSEKLEGMHTFHDLAAKDPLSPLPVGDGWRIG